MRAEGGKRPELDRLRVQLPVRQRHASTRSATTASPATRRTSKPARTRARRASTRSPKARRPAPPRPSSAGSRTRMRPQDHHHAVAADQAEAERRLLERLSNPWPDHRAERTLGAVSLLVCALVVAMVVFVGDPRVADLRAQRPVLAGAGRRSRQAAGRHAEHDAAPAAVGVSPARVAARVRDAADDVRRGRAGAGDRDLLLDLHRRARARRGCAAWRSR